ncbi:MAG TPA: UDP-glucose 4-epimerase GalE [Candidatus Fimivivens sp.]|nr:UDP-glucose 4-epimerase GalE [Candidatus Fimivivens sp.]
MKILVTGGAGYIGSHTVRALRSSGHQVVIFDNLSTGHRSAVSDFEFFHGDLANRSDLEAVFSRHSFDAVVHFAGSIEAGESMKDPKRFFDNNVRNGLNLLEAMLAHGVMNIVFSSTAAVYGEPERMPVTEDAPTVPTNVYGLSKLMFEQVLEAYDAAYGLKSVRFRYFNAAGADASAKIGEDHPNESHLIPLVLRTAQGKRENIKIFGTDLSTEDGTGIRDYVHVNDLADAHVLAIDYLAKNGKSDVFNLGNGNGISVRTVIEVSRRITGIGFAVTEEPRRPGDPEKLFASSEKAKSILGWKPRYSGIEKIIESAWGWHKAHPDGFAEND